MAMTTNQPPLQDISALPPAQQLQRIDQARRAGQFAEAERLCRILVTKHPRDIGALNAMAVLLKDRGELKEAETLMQRALAGAPQNAALYNNLGTILRLKNDKSGSERAYLKAISLQPNYPEAINNLGIAREEAGHREEALELFHRATSLRVSYFEAWTHAGKLLSEMDRLPEALDDLDKALAINPHYFAAVFYRGIVLTALDRHDEAITALQLAVSMQPASYEARLGLANALARAGKNDAALESYAKVIETNPEFLPAHYAYNSLAWTMGRKDLNLTSYAAARARVGDKPDLLLAEARQRLRQDDYAGAELLLRNAQSVAPGRGDIANALGRALYNQNRIAEGIETLQGALQAEPNSLDHRRELAIALLRDRQPAAARQVLEEALRIDPFDQLILAFLTLAYRELGDSRLERLVDSENLVRVFDLPVPAGFADTDAFNQALGAELAALHTRKVEPFDQTLRGGTQTVGHLFVDKGRAIQMLREQISDAVAEYIRDLPDDPSHPFLARKEAKFTYTGAWSCQLRSNGFHANHVHHQGWISSAYYVAVPDEVADATSQQGWLKFGESNMQLGERDRPSRVVKPAVGKLALFPSYFWHGTVPFTSDATRLTVAFDVVPGFAVAPGGEPL